MLYAKKGSTEDKWLQGRSRRKGGVARDWPYIVESEYPDGQGRKWVIPWEDSGGNALLTATIGVKIGTRRELEELRGKKKPTLKKLF